MPSQCQAGQDDTFAFCMCSKEDEESVVYLIKLGSLTEVVAETLDKVVLETSK